MWLETGQAALDAETTLARRNDGRVFLKQKRDAAYDGETVSYSKTLPAF